MTDPLIAIENLTVSFAVGGVLHPAVKDLSLTLHASEVVGLVGESGSISAAGRTMNMSYRRAWMLIDGLNRCFRTPVVETHFGGARGGGAVLTELGHDLIDRYRTIERAATKASAHTLAALEAAQKNQRAAGPRERKVRSSVGTRQRSSSMPRRAHS